MEIHVLGAAATVTGSQFLLTTSRARVLVDCGMFQGSPHEVVRNRVPLAYDPAGLDAILLTHAHLDHCGLIPHVVKEGFRGPIFATAGTVELAGLVLLDSGKLQEEFAKRHRHWALRHPDRAAREDAREAQEIEAQIELAEATDEPAQGRPGDLTADGHVVSSGVDELAIRDEQGLGTRLGYPPFGHPDHDAAMHGLPARPNLVVEEPLYSQAEARAALERFRPVGYDEPVDVAPGIQVTWRDAGHILGSAILEVRVEAETGTPARTVVFSGDLGRTGAPILRDPTRLREADYVFVESTYGGREHEPEEESVGLLEQIVRTTADAAGVMLVPSFAIGRTQEIVWELRRLADEGRIPVLPLFLDSPMASKATAIYRHHPEYYDEATAEVVRRGEQPLEYPAQRVTDEPAQSEAIERARPPYMIVASNGMLTGGRVLNHLRDVVGDPKATIVFVGYQGEGTLGARLQSGAKSARIDGEERAVRCAVRSIGGFSAHADESELLDWLGGFIDGRKAGDPGVPRRVFLVHGDPDAQQALEAKVRALGLPTYVPQWHQRLQLD